MEADRADRILPASEALAMRSAATVLASPRRPTAAQRLAPLAARR
ncbi:hypothetical protein ACIRPX_36560 [Streptomyces sp. NPDC101225]